jgi:hypothetical protein
LLKAIFTKLSNTNFTSKNNIFKVKFKKKISN